jgi:hypothetical protein
MIIYLLALCIGVVAGMRAMTAPTAISWAAHLGWLPLETTWLAPLGYAWTPWIFTLLAVVELVTDQTAINAQPNCPYAIRGASCDGSAVRRGNWFGRGVAHRRRLGGIDWRCDRYFGRTKCEGLAGKGIW